MDVKAYIESGILEEVVLGTASNQEQQEVSCMSKIYPEIRTYMDQLEKTLENYALVNQVAPPEEMRTRVLNAISELKAGSEKPESDTKVIQMPKPDSGRSVNWLAAASIALLLVMSGLYFMQRTDISSLRNTVAMLTNVNGEAKDSLSAINSNLVDISGEFAILKDPSNSRIVLNGVEASPNSLATIYWNQNTKETHLLVNNLPLPPKGKQYQLWAIADGVPVDMGVFNVNATETALQKMISMPNAQAFAVTLEIEGGSPTPTLEEMVVIGNV